MKRRVKAYLVLVVFFLVSEASAQDLFLDTEVRFETFTDDEYLLGEEDSNTEAVRYTPRMELSYNGRSYQSSLIASGFYSEHVTTEIPGRDDFGASWSQSLFGESSGAALLVEYDERLVEELLELDGSANFSVREKVETLSVAPSYYKNLSPRDQVEISYIYGYTRAEDVDSEDAVGSNDNDQHTLELSYGRTVSPRTTVGVYGLVSGYRPGEPIEGVDEDAELFGFGIAGSHQFGTRWSLQGSLGGSQLSTSAAPDNPRFEVIADGDTLVSADISLDFQGERDTFGINIASGTTPQLDGVLDVQVDTQISWNRSLSETWSTDFRLRHLQAERNDRTSDVFSASLNWQAAPSLSFDLGYRFIKQDSEVDEFTGIAPVTGESNRVTLIAVYSFQQLRFAF